MMGSWFDSKVYQRRRANEWMSVNLLDFARDVSDNTWGLDNPPRDDVILTIAPRPDVASRYWYTLEWTAADGTRRSVSSQEYGLMLWRAAVTEEDARAEVNSKNGAFVVSILGFRIEGDKVFEKRVKAHMEAVEASQKNLGVVYEVWNAESGDTLVLVRQGASFIGG